MQNAEGGRRKPNAGLPFAICYLPSIAVQSWRCCSLPCRQILSTGCVAPVATAALVNVETGVDAAAWAKIPTGEFVLGQHEDEGMVDKPYEIMLTDTTDADPRATSTRRCRRAR